MLKKLSGLVDGFSINQMILVILTVVILCIGLLGYQVLYNKDEPFATVNLQKVVELQEASLTLKSLEPQELSIEAERFAILLKKELASLQERCDCTLLVSSAVVGQHRLTDYTDELISRLRLDPRASEYARTLMQKTLKSDSLGRTS